MDIKDLITDQILDLGENGIDYLSDLLLKHYSLKELFKAIAKKKVIFKDEVDDKNIAYFYKGQRIAQVGWYYYWINTDYVGKLSKKQAKNYNVRTDKAIIRLEKYLTDLGYQIVPFKFSNELISDDDDSEIITNNLE